MSHVDENNFAIVQFDLLVQEYIKSSRSTNTFVYLVSPYLSNYSIPSTWPSFASNVLDISDIDTFEDLLKLLCQNNVEIKILTYASDFMREKTSLKEWHISRQEKFIVKLSELGCKIFCSEKNHGKITVTSQGVLFGSANITTTGMTADLQWNVGHYFPKSKKQEYQEKLKYVDEKFLDSNPMKTEGLVS